ncbi:hypothetical protein [Testudinibacter sp. TR-2022]|uniref:hypothetical protein n=1 Tax=Testudinibacter sp. TR-2022 TaxID=2585029 RepID=UPI001118A78F|nr:hypothetical protein [Testudinibacter sp. TR-2022]TNH06615.1 hypothetical protein FHQ30_07150 [Pasteurellaceae bacterium Phil11]TNH25546.1 hypothetical protein FHQ29_01375 [Testudinibacter sp. TR-2022]TNH25674.1 hypothetical protein FHQ27_08720 [Testudinibacter sp. TR-2022]
MSYGFELLDEQGKLVLNHELPTLQYGASTDSRLHNLLDGQKERGGIYSKYYVPLKAKSYYPLVVYESIEFIYPIVRQVYYPTNFPTYLTGTPPQHKTDYRSTEHGFPREWLNDGRPHRTHVVEVHQEEAMENKVNVHVFENARFLPPNDAQYGMQVFDDTGTLLYDTSRTLLRILDVIQINHGDRDLTIRKEYPMSKRIGFAVYGTVTTNHNWFDTWMYLHQRAPQIGYPLYFWHFWIKLYKSAWGSWTPSRGMPQYSDWLKTGYQGIEIGKNLLAADSNFNSGQVFGQMTVLVVDLESSLPEGASPDARLYV